MFPQIQWTVWHAYQHLFWAASSSPELICNAIPIRAITYFDHSKPSCNAHFRCPDDAIRTTTATMNINNIPKSNTYVFRDDFRYSPNNSMPQNVLTSGSALQHITKFQISSNNIYMKIDVVLWFFLYGIKDGLNVPAQHLQLHTLQLGLPWTGYHSRTRTITQLKVPSLCHSSHWCKPWTMISVGLIRGGRERWC